MTRVTVRKPQGALEQLCAECHKPFNTTTGRGSRDSVAFVHTYSESGRWEATELFHAGPKRVCWHGKERAA